MTVQTYPGGLRELDFAAAYCDSALRKPQVAADTALRSLVLAGATDRIALVGLIAEQLVEAARRLTAVYLALSDRRYVVAKSLLGPLPGAAAWEAFLQDALSLSPEQLLRHLSVGEEALPALTRLRAQPDLSFVTDLIRACETGSGMVVIPPSANGRAAPDFWLAGTDAGGAPVAAAVGAGEQTAAALADLTADLSSIARGLLDAYLAARRAPLRRS